MTMDDRNYAGFWIRTGAALIDSVAILLLIVPVLTFIYGKGYWFDDSLYKGVWDIVLNFVFPAIAVVLFWLYRSATPGKMLTRLVIVDAQTGEKTLQRTVHRPLPRLLRFDAASFSGNLLGGNRQAKTGLSRQNGGHGGYPGRPSRIETRLTLRISPAPFRRTLAVRCDKMQDPKHPNNITHCWGVVCNHFGHNPLYFPDWQLYLLYKNGRNASFESNPTPPRPANPKKKRGTATGCRRPANQKCGFQPLRCLDRKS